MLQEKREGNGVLWLGAIVGLVGIFGIGHFFMGHTKRGVAFLAMTGALAVYVLVGPFLLPNIWQTPASPTAIFGVLWLVQTYDLYRLSRRAI